MNDTPRGNRTHIAFFGLRNAGKSTLVNAFTGQHIAIVSDIAGTTTDPVSKAMEILPLGPCLVTDTAGLDDVGELGSQRVAKSLEVLSTTDIAVWVNGADDAPGAEKSRFLAECRSRNVAVVEYRRGESVESLKGRIVAIRPAEAERGLLDGLVDASTRVIAVCPIDESAPRGRLILPQQQLLRESLDRHLASSVCQPGELRRELDRLAPGERALVVTDAQAFAAASAAIEGYRAAASAAIEGYRAAASSPAQVSLTAFSILFARQKGDAGEYLRGLDAIAKLRDGDLVLVAEGCTHHRQCNDIGTVKIPRALARLTGRKLEFRFASGASFSLGDERPALVVQCGGCMLTRREVMRRIALAREAKVPIVNYGMLLAKASGCAANASQGLSPQR